ncbi:MAG: acetyl-CoA carboxylase biotin carboxyl carrier protein [Planctomycetota bacterium]|jgi:acetyl-CoA carboxylase biotin carboxyl carrier protein
MDLEELQKLIELMNSNDLVEVKYEDGDKKICLTKASANQPMIAMQPAPSMMAPATGANASVADSVEGHSATFNSPMVGTFYSSPSPTADPFVRVGDKIGASSVLCIVEAMKVLNEITADMDGEILEVLVGNGEAVEYGQPLFTIKPR